MYSSYPTDRRASNRQSHETATQRKAMGDSQYFWDLVQRHMNGQYFGPKRMARHVEENFLFSKKAESVSAGVIDDKVPVERSGPQTSDTPTLESFDELKGAVPSSVSRCIELLRYERPSPIQKHAIPLGLAGLDLMCCAQTGSGKTFAFLVPVVTALDPAFARRSEAAPSDSVKVVSVDERGALPRGVILAPTRELASQIQLDARRLTFGSSIRSVCVYGGNDIRAQLQELSVGCELIVATPGRLNDLVERGCVSLSQVSFLVLDEADRMLDMGFEPQIRRIVLDYDMPNGEHRQTFMFSATFPNEIQTLAREFLRNYVWIAVGRVGSTVENIKQQVLLASSDPMKKLELLTSVLGQCEGRTLVFVQKKKTASWLCQCLRSMYRVTAEEIHGDRSQSQREHALKMFREGHINILVATDVAARGLDVPQVMHVIQFDMPLSSEDFDVYVHRIGRTGRAGMPGLATSFFVPGRETGEGNGRIARQLLTLLQENHQDVPDWFHQLEDLGGGSAGNHRRPDGRKPGGRFGFHDVRSNQQKSSYYGHGGSFGYEPSVRGSSFSRSGLESHSSQHSAAQYSPHVNSYGRQFPSHTHGSSATARAHPAAPAASNSYGSSQPFPPAPAVTSNAHPQQAVYDRKAGVSSDTTPDNGTGGASSAPSGAEASASVSDVGSVNPNNHRGHSLVHSAASAGGQQSHVPHASYQQTSFQPHVGYPQTAPYQQLAGFQHAGAYQQSVGFQQQQPTGYYDPYTGTYYPPSTVPNASPGVVGAHQSMNASFVQSQPQASWSHVDRRQYVAQNYQVHGSPASNSYYDSGPYDGGNSSMRMDYSQSAGGSRRWQPPSRHSSAHHYPPTMSQVHNYSGTADYSGSQTLTSYNSSASQAPNSGDPSSSNTFNGSQDQLYSAGYNAHQVSYTSLPSSSRISTGRPYQDVQQQVVSSDVAPSDAAHEGFTQPGGNAN